MESRREIRTARRAYRSRQRHRRNTILGISAAVLVLLTGSFGISRLMNTSSARDGLTEDVASIEIINKSSNSKSDSSLSEELNLLHDADVSVEYRAKSEHVGEGEDQGKKVSREGFSNELDIFVRLAADATIYSRPSTKSEAVMAVSKGTYLESYGSEKDWTKVDYKGHKGYIRNRDLGPVEDKNLFKVVDGKLIVNSVYGLDPSYETVFNEDAAAGLKIMLEAMKRDGIEVEVSTAYRSYKDEEKERVLSGSPTSAPLPGHAVFQTGYGVSFHAPNTDPRIDNNFENSMQFAWLKEHAPEYGFILRYPEGSESVTGYREDPTIFYYVGVEDASIISNEGLTMEVFYGVNR